MNKSVVAGITFMVAAAAVNAFADDAQSLMERRRAAFEKRVGGWVIRRNPDSRPLRIVNAQEQLPVDYLKPAAKSFDDLLDIDVRIEKGAFNGKGEMGCLYVIFDQAKPSMLIAPEEGWGVMNVAKLGNANVQDRCTKELWRTFMFMGGGANSELEHCLMRPVFKPEDLDSEVTKVPSPSPLAVMPDHLALMGIKQFTRSTYVEACRGGWAPAPTNDVQKAIWEKVHKLPTNPLPLVKPTK